VPLLLWPEQTDGDGASRVFKQSSRLMGGFFYSFGLMIGLGLTGNLADVVNAAARQAGDQLPFALALALTRTAQAGKREVEAQMPSVIDRPTPYTMRGFRLDPASKDKLLAEVTFRPAFGSGSDARDYLSPLVFGGERKVKAFERSLQRVGLIPSGYAAVPGAAAKIDAYGNMQRGQIVQIVSYFQAFGEQGYSANMTAKRKAAMAKGNKRTGKRGVVYFRGRPGSGRLPLGIWERTSFGAAGSAIKPVVIFVPLPSYAARLDVGGIAERVMRDQFAAELDRAVQQARRTAIPKRQLPLI
jgi:hypothetical protein